MSMIKIITCFCSLFLFVESFASIKVTELYENINFPPTEKVRILVEVPNEPHLVFAKIEKRGNEKTSTLKLLSEMEDVGKEMGADAFVLERKVQRFTDGSYLIKSDVIKYTSSIKALVDQGFVLNYTPVGFKAGVESDFVSFVLGGMGFTVWAGKSRWAGQFSYFRSDIPESFWKDGFIDPMIHSGIELSASYFFNSGLKGIYASAGIGQIKGKVGHEAELIQGKFTKNYFLLGIGYKRFVYSFFYIQSRVAGCLNFGGDKSFTVGSQLAEIGLISPLLSISVGYQFSF